MNPNTPQRYPAQTSEPAATQSIGDAHHSAEDPKREQEVILISHSSLYYWWPVWVMGFVMAGITYWNGSVHQLGAERVWFHPDGNLGVIFLLTVFMVIVISSVSVRGLASALVIVTGMLIAVLLAYLGAWDPIFDWFGDLRVYLNLGAYFWFSLLVFVAWVLTVFVFDRLSYWRVTPGQITRTKVFGAAARTYDTENLVLEKHRDDFFRHWVLGLGSGDLLVRPHGARNEELAIPNVLFVGAKLNRIQALIATEPTEHI